jgi:hypothetical protein
VRENKDNTAKWMIDHHGDAILRMGGVSGFSSWRASQTTLAHPRELPDGLLEVAFPGQAQADLFVIEVATYPERRAEEQAARDAALVLLDRGVLPDVITLVLHPKGQIRVGGNWQQTSRHGTTHLGFSWQVVEMDTLSAEQLLALNDVGVVPWVPLAQTALPVTELLRTCRERIEQQARPEEVANLLAVAQVMTTLRYNDPSLLAIIGGRRMIIETPLIQEILAEVRREDLHKYILGLLQEKFGGVPSELAARVRAVQDIEQLRQFMLRAGACSDLDAFRAHLPS